MIDREHFEAAVRDAGPIELIALAGELHTRAAAGMAEQGKPAKAGDQLLTMPEVAEALQVSEKQARRMGKSGELPVVLVGERGVRVRRADLHHWVNARRAGGR